MTREDELKMAKEPAESVFLVFLKILVANRKPLAILWIGLALASTIVSFLLTKEYTTESVFQVQTSGGGLNLPLPEGLKMLDPKFKSSGTGVALAILDSRKLAMTMINSFDLKRKYKTKWDHLAIKQFRKNFESEMFDEGIIRIQFTYPSPDSVKIIADSIISFVNQRSIEFATNKAKFEYRFNRSMYDSVLQDLDSLSQTGIKYLNHAGIADFEKHVELSLKTYNRLQESLVGLESEYAVAKVENQKTPTEMRGMQEMISVLKGKQRELAHRRPASSKSADYSFGIDYDSIPKMSVYLERLALLVEKDKMILKALIPKMEESRMRMIETTPMLNIIDPTYVPPYKSGPKRILVILLSTFGFGFLITGAFIIWQVLRNPLYKLASVQEARDLISSMT